MAPQLHQYVCVNASNTTSDADENIEFVTNLI